MNLFVEFYSTNVFIVHIIDNCDVSSTSLTTLVGWLLLRQLTVLSRSAIIVFCWCFIVLSRCFLDFSVGVWAFVIGLSQISSFFSDINMHNKILKEFDAHDLIIWINNNDCVLTPKETAMYRPIQELPDLPQYIYIFSFNRGVLKFYSCGYFNYCWGIWFLGSKLGEWYRVCAWPVIIAKVIGNNIHTSVYDKRDDFGFPIINFPLLNVPRLPSYCINISQLVRFARCCTSVYFPF